MFIWDMGTNYKTPKANRKAEKSAVYQKERFERFKEKTVKESD